MKTIQEYMNDPRILNDPLMENALEPVKEIHAIRLKIQDETAGMTVAEESEYRRKKAERLFAEFGFPSPHYVDLSGQGKLQPRHDLVSTDT
jgi:hypothetical protein